ncbi:MAG: hypothetical protein NVS2B17_20410 [Candidatus Velthaea sp.]
MLRFVLAVWAAVLLTAFGGMMPAAAAPESQARSRFDRRVDAIPSAMLLHAAPQSLVDRSRQRGARTVTDVQQTLFFGWAFAQIAAFGWLWRSGNAARMRDWLRRRVRGRLAMRAAFGAALGAFAPLSALPFAFIRYRVGFNVGLTEERIGTWLLHYSFGLLVDAIATAIVVAVVLELVDRTRLWYLAFIALVYASTIGIVAVGPVVYSATATRQAPPNISASAPVLIASSSARTKTLYARVEGLGRLTRIVLGDTLVAAATPAELRYVLAHEDAHIEHDDVLKLAAMGTTMLVIACAFAVLISDRIGFRRDDDPHSRLALVGAFLGAVALIAFPLYNAYARGVEYRADEDARGRLGDPAGAIRFLVRRADDDMISLCYRRSSSWYFADHPAIGTRIATMRGTLDPCPRYGR